MDHRFDRLTLIRNTDETHFWIRLCDNRSTLSRKLCMDGACVPWTFRRSKFGGPAVGFYWLRSYFSRSNASFHILPSRPICSFILGDNARCILALFVHSGPTSPISIKPAIFETHLNDIADGNRAKEPGAIFRVCPRIAKILSSLVSPFVATIVISVAVRSQAPGLRRGSHSYFFCFTLRRTLLRH